MNLESISNITVFVRGNFGLGEREFIFLEEKDELYLENIPRNKIPVGWRCLSAGN